MLPLNHLDQKFSRKLIINREHFLYFGGTAYLGIPSHKKFLKLHQKGVRKFGLNNGTSRNNNIQLGIYNEAEHTAANRFGAAAALIVSSGYLAAILAVTNFTSNQQVRYAPKAHPSLWLDNKQSTIGSFNNWMEQTVKEINNSEENNWVLISNSMDNLFPEIYDFGPLEKIMLHKKITLIVDDSHGIGINNNGQSVMLKLPKRKNIKNIVVASMAKALGIDAGVILSSVSVIDDLKRSNIFAGASPPSAAALYAFINAAKIYDQQREKLDQNILNLANHLIDKQEWQFVDGFPVFLVKEKAVCQKLIGENILISSFPYPTKDGEIINRLVLSSWHKKKDINRLKNIL